ncbi:MAG: hypothetical protein ACREH4_16015, partial [Vitreimonas sp.]
MRTVLKALGAGLAFWALAGAAAAQDRQVRAYLEHGLQRHSPLGFASDTATADLVIPLRLDHPFLWTVNLRAGVTYRIYGACDDNCADLDMELYGLDGQLVDRDTRRDDTPYVQVTPVRSGRHNVRIWLYSCRAAACHAAARIVSGGRAQEREAA